MFSDDRALPQLICFQGQGFQINSAKKEQCDRRAKFVFQTKADIRKIS